MSGEKRCLQGYFLDKTTLRTYNLKQPDRALDLSEYPSPILRIFPLGTFL